MHEVISSSLTVPTKNKSTAYAVLLFLVGNAKESSGRGRKPSAVRVRSAAKNFAPQAQALTVPYHALRPIRKKPPKMGAFCYGGECRDSSRCGVSRSYSYSSAAENFAAHAASPYRPLPRITSDTLKPPKMGGLLRGRFSASAGGFRIKPPAEVKTRANTTRNRRSPYPSACVKSCSERNTCT